jgi:hypothetical protein
MKDDGFPHIFLDRDPLRPVAMQPGSSGQYAE